MGDFKLFDRERRYERQDRRNDRKDSKTERLVALNFLENQKLSYQSDVEVAKYNSRSTSISQGENPDKKVIILIVIILSIGLLLFLKNQPK